MINIRVTSNLKALGAKISRATEASQMKFATALAMTTTAKQIQAEVVQNMPQRFTLRRDWVQKGIRIVPATKASLQASVYSKDEAFMGRQETGGTKTPKRDQHLAVPLKGVRRTKKQLIREADLPNNLGKATYDVTRTNRKTGASTTKTKKGAGGEIIKIKSKRGRLILARRRPGKELELLYLLVPRAQIKERLKLREDGERILRRNFGDNLKAAIERALATAR